MIGGLLKGIAGTMGRGGKKPAPAPMDEVPRPGADDTGKPNLLRKFGGRLKRDVQGSPAATIAKGVGRFFGKRKGPARGGKR